MRSRVHACLGLLAVVLWSCLALCKDGPFLAATDITVHTVNYPMSSLEIGVPEIFAEAGRNIHKLRFPVKNNSSQELASYTVRFVAYSPYGSPVGGEHVTFAGVLQPGETQVVSTTLATPVQPGDKGVLSLSRYVLGDKVFSIPLESDILKRASLGPEAQVTSQLLPMGATRARGL